MPAPTAAEVLADFSPRHRRDLAAALGVGFEADALSKALTWLDSRSIRNGFPIEWDPEPTGDPKADAAAQTRARILRDAVLARAQFRAWGRAEREETARDKRREADDLLEGLVGDGYDPGAGDAEAEAAAPASGVPMAAVAAPVRSALSLRHRFRRGL